MSNSRKALQAVAAMVVLASLPACLARADTSYGELVGSRSYVFSEGACFREAPYDSSAAVCCPPPGTPVFDLAAVDIQHSENGLTSTWMEGSCVVGDEELRGYIPLSRLALTSLELGEDTLLLVGLESGDSTIFRRVGVAKVLSGGRMLWGAVFGTPAGMGETSFAYGVSSEVLDPSGLRGVEDLVRISFVYEACGYENRDVLLAWTGRYLVGGPTASRVAEAGVFHFAQEILLPGSDPAFPNLVRIASIEEQWDDAGMEYHTVALDTAFWDWSGIEFVELPR